MESSMIDSIHEDESSDAFSPEPKPVKGRAPPKKTAGAAPKTNAAKKLTQTTLKTAKPAASKKRTKADSDEENSSPEDSLDDDSLLSNTPPAAKKQKKALPPKKTAGRPLEPINNESSAMEVVTASAAKPKPKAKATASDQYQKLTQLEHILKRPDTYIGSVERTEQQMWVYNSDLESMESRKVSFVPGLYKIFDEILVNAADNKQRDKNMDEIRVEIDREAGLISIRNNGKGIPIEMHNKEGIYIPEMIFGHLLTGSNYDDDEQKVTGGRNGYGAKLCNIYSTEFTLETADVRSKQKYKQVWRNNMSQMGKASITQHKGEDFTRITFKPDFKKFGMDEMDKDFEALALRRVYDMAGTCKDVKVLLNGERIKCRNFKKYMEMYTKAVQAEKPGEPDGESKDAQVILTDNPHERWEIGFAVSDGSFQQVSFVNSIATTSGGTHVNYIADQIVDKLAAVVKTKNKGGVTLKGNQIRNHIFLFVNCLITNPAFTSQTKEQLTTKQSQFGSKCVLSDKFLKDIAKTEAVQNIIHFAQQKADQLLKKSDGNRRTRMNNSKLTDANKAGTKDGHRCTLILTEGDSASLLALAGRAVVDPDLIGVFPLRGKLLNVRDASVDQITKNAEIQNIKKFMGLQHKRVYEDTKSLRYGHLMIMTDQDHDGSHIKGLLINFLECQFPSLLKLPGFLQEFITPIVKVWKGDPKRPKKAQSFFTMPEYEAWKEQPGNERGWDHKYYKGLGTSEPSSDAEVYFRDLDRHLKQFHILRRNELVNESDLIDLAFSKKRADARKEWLREFRPGTFLDMTSAQITYEDFINKELILFSMADNMRSIPSVIDGFKPGQRKVLYTCFRRNLKKDVKVVELAGSVSGLTAYAYGDTSLQQTIVGLAQNFVGSNNINCLEPSGNFGSRLQGGADSASVRYIYTRLSPFARRIFHQTDEALLTYNTDDGKTIEPEMYCPILPMILVNGSDGIGTGWSSSIPNYNPVEIVENLKIRMQSSSKEDMKPMKPWFRNWTNEVEDVGNDRFKFSGTIRQTGDLEVEITELPVRMWTQDFKDKLEDIIKAERVPSIIKDYHEYNTPTKVHFIIKLDGEKHMKNVLESGLEEAFKLSKTMATTNLVAFDSQGRINKYATVLDIMEEFYHHRLKMYVRRKEYLLNQMQQDLDKLNNQARFVKMIVDGKLIVSKKKKTTLVAELRAKDFKPIPKLVDAKKQGEFEPVLEEEDEKDAVDEQATGANDFDYLLGMAIWSLTQERIDRLLKQIGDKEVEVDTLIKTSEKQLWTADLDDFVAEWHTSLAEEATRKKEISRMGRRASQKLKIGTKGGAKKRKADDSDESDYAVAKIPKTQKSKAAEIFGYLDQFERPSEQPVAPKPRQGLLTSTVEQKPVEKPPAVRQGLIKDESSAQASEIEIDGRKQPLKSTKGRKVISDDEEEDEVLIDSANLAKTKSVQEQAKKKGKAQAPISTHALAPPLASRVGRAAAKKPVSYNDDSSSDSSFAENFDVAGMVKTFGGATAGPSKALFSNSASASRPSSSHSVTKPRLSRPADDDMDIDSTDYHALIPLGSPAKPAARNAREFAGSDDDDDDPLDIPRISKLPFKATATAATKPKLIQKPKKTVASTYVPLAKKPLSPAAKAYAKGKLKSTATASKVLPPAMPKAVKKAVSKKKPVDSDDGDDDLDQIVHDLISDDEDLAGPTIAAARSRRVAAKPASYKVDPDEGDGDEDEASEDDDAMSEDDFDDDE